MKSRCDHTFILAACSLHYLLTVVVTHLLVARWRGARGDVIIKDSDSSRWRCAVSAGSGVDFMRTQVRERSRGFRSRMKACHAILKTNNCIIIITGSAVATALC